MCSIFDNLLQKCVCVRACVRACVCVCVLFLFFYFFFFVVVVVFCVCFLVFFSMILKPSPFDTYLFCLYVT